MRHRNKNRTLDRTAGARRALLASLAAHLIRSERITTTRARAKEVRRLAERLIRAASGSEKSLMVRRSAIASLREKTIAKKLVEELGPRYKDRKGGYTRIILLAPRKGDGAKQAQLELV